MKRKLRLLNIEDSEIDTELLARHLAKAGYEVDWKRVDTLPDLEESLKGESWDLFVCDYSIPGFSVDEALECVKANSTDTPFFVISGTILEEKAIDLLRAGACDYLMKDNLARLVPAIERELQEVKNRRHKKELESARDESEKRLRLALSAAKMGVWDWNIPADEIHGSPEFYEIWGIDSAIRKPSDFDIVYHRNDFNRVVNLINEAIDSHQLFEAEFRIIKDGKVRHLSNTGLTEYDEDGNPLRMIGTIRDISARVKSEEGSHKSEARFRALASSVHLVWIADAEGKAPNPNAKSTSGFDTMIDDEANPWWLESVHPDDREEVLEKWTDSVRTTEVYEIEHRYRFEGEDYKYYYVRAVPVFYEDGNVREWVGLNIDITERKLAEAALHESETKLNQSQKLESVGRLAGGIAHDFNNMLTAINGYSDLALRKLDVDHPIRSYIEEIKKSGERSALLTHQLLAFSRKQVLSPKIVDINKIILEISSMMSRLTNEDIQFESQLASDLRSVRVDSGQLSQVIMNLIVNAKDAMPAGGVLTISTKNQIFENQESADPFNAKPGKYVLLEVTDTGTGMEKDVLENIFEPFFSTKAATKGTGLGLSTVYGIVNQSGGYISVASERGTGSAFKIFFPQADESANQIVDRAATGGSQTGTETVLLVEDEEMVRNLCRQLLESSGYKVVEARNGIEAIEKFEKRNGGIDLLMTDIVMPKMGGKELAEKLTALSPNLPVLFMSGYPDDAVVQHGIIEPEMNYLQKPFSFDALTLKLREFLDN